VLRVGWRTVRECEDCDGEGEGTGEKVEMGRIGWKGGEGEGVARMDGCIAHLFFAGVPKSGVLSVDGKER